MHWIVTSLNEEHLYMARRVIHVIAFHGIQSIFMFVSHVCCIYSGSCINLRARSINGRGA